MALALVAAAAAAERLPVRAWGAADGLGHDHVRCALRDSQGFLWFGTALGVSRFDGERFRRFGVADGLPGARVHALAQTADGSLWAATERGLARLAPAPVATAPRFESVPLPDRPEAVGVRALLVDSDGSLLAGTERGLVRVRWTGTGEIEAEAVEPCDGVRFDVRALTRDARGKLWIGGADGRLVGGSGDGCRSLELAAPGQWIRALAVDRRGRLWIGSDAGLARLDDPGAAGPVRRIGPAEGVAANRVRSLHEDPDGVLWIGAVGGLYRGDGERFERYTVADGLPDETVNGFARDRNGRLWLATDSAGAVRLLEDGFVSYDRADGLGHPSVSNLFEDRDGALVVGGEVGGWISRRAGSRFEGLQPKLPAALAARVAGSVTWALEDHAGEWWLATVGGLVRYARPARFGDLARTAPLAVWGTGRGLPADWCYRLFETGSGELWVATDRGDDGDTLARIAADRRGVERFGPASGLPGRGGASSFAESPDGGLWVGWSDGSLLRFEGGRFRRVGGPDGYPVQDLLSGPDGLWLATGGAGLGRLGPDGVDGARSGGPVPAGPPELAHADIRALARGADGILWIATTEGVFRWRTGDERARRFTGAEGLAGLEATAVHVDRSGAVWVGTYNGLSRRSGETRRSAPPPTPLWIRSLEIDGAVVPVSPLGQDRLGPLSLGAGRHRLRIGLLGLAFGPGESLRVRYRLVGLDSTWSAPAEATSLTFGGIGAGRYRFEAVAAGAGSAARPAVIEWLVPPPLWQRGWFLGLIALAVAAAGVGGHRLRVARLLEVERVRSRIAGDLHDDLSANLTRISILSEVARRGLPGDGAERVAPLLTEIGEGARDLLDSTRDLVWAIDPREETLAALVARLRSFLAGLLDATEVAWRLTTSGEPAAVHLGPEARRHLLLLLKEAVHNAIRHGRPGRLEVRLDAGPEGLHATIEDDGRGFDADALLSSGGLGRGLRGMEQRARALGGRLRVESRPGVGTCVRLEAALPVRRTDVRSFSRRRSERLGR